MHCNSRILTKCILLAACLSQIALAADWPMYKADPQRSGVTPEALKFPLAKRWVYEPSQPARPAWPEPGKELHRIDFDYAFQPVVADGLVYFGSSADDTVRACDAASGKLVWRFTTGGPVRFAPAIANGRAYVASDDGYAYCLGAKTGKLIWRFRGGPSDAQMLGNGRMISRWPLRTGVLVVGNTVYVTAGMWPTQGVYVYALDADTGKKRWLNDSSGNIYINLPHCGSSAFSGVTPQGYLLVSGDRLLVPTGRSVPAAFDRRTGRLLYYYPEKSCKDGGTWVTAAGGFYFNPANPSWWHSHSTIGEAQPRMGDGMCAHSAETGKRMWRSRNCYRVLAAKGILYAAQVGNKIEAFEPRRWSLPERAKSYRPGHSIWSTAHPRVYSLALLNNALLVGGNDSITALNVKDGKQFWQAKVDGQVRGMAIARGRLVAGTSKGTVICFAPGSAAAGAARRITEKPSVLVISDAQKRKAAAIVKETGVSAGYALVLGEPDARLAEALAAQTNLHVISLLRGTSALANERKRLLATSRYGSRLVVQGRDDLSRLPYAAYFAGLIVVSGDARGISGKEIYRVLRPCGGKLVFRGIRNSLVRKLLRDGQIPTKEIAGDGRMVVRGVLPGAGEWRHQWADGGHTGAGNETRLRLPLDLLWFGGPGPDRMMDRTGASPPLSVNGVVFITGEHHVISYDAYTGRELWCREFKGAGRIGIRQTSSNFAADDDSLYLATASECLRLDQASGKPLAKYQVPADLEKNKAFPSGFAPEGEHQIATNKDKPENMGWGWGYVGVTDDLLLGSHRLPKRYAKKLYGYVPWWEPRYSVALFALDKKKGALRWCYRAKRAISGQHIAFGGGRVFLLDATPNPDVYGKAKRRGKKAKIDRTLIALNLIDGTEQWRQEIPSLAGAWANLQYAKGIVVLGVNWAFDAKTGKKLWQRGGGPRRPPVIQGNWVIDMRCAYDLRTGAPRMSEDMLTGVERPWRFMRSRGCGNIAGCQNLLFFRGATHGFFESDTESFTTFGGVRPNCAVGITAANGLVNAPETSSGCECSYNFQTSLALVPGESRGDSWVVFPFLSSTAQTTNIKTMRLNLGAPGDRTDRQRLKWLGFPQLGIRSQTRVPAPVTVVMENPDWYHHPSDTSSVKGPDKPWLYTCGLRGQGRIQIDLVLTGRRERRIVVHKCGEPPKVDGVLDDACWRDAKPVAFAGNAHTAEPETTLLIRRDAKAIYFGYRRKAVVRNGKPVPFVAKHTGDDARCWEDDDFEIIVTNQRRRAALHFGVNCAGGRFDGLIRGVSRERPRDLRWNGEWASAVKKNAQEWTAEIAIPLAPLAKEKVQTAGPRNLRINCLSRNVSGHGVGKMYLIHPDLEFYRGRNYLPVMDKPLPPPADRLCTVRLHFIESQDVAPGQRLFDVLLQGKRILRDFDIIKQAGGRFRPVVREFKDVRASGALMIETVSRSSKHPPVINAVEIMETGPPPKFPDAKPPVVDKHTIALLHFDEKEGTEAKDASPNGFHAKLEKAPNDPEWHAKGRFGGCLKFDGDNPDKNGDKRGDADGLRWLKGLAPDPKGSGYTVEMWVKHKHLNGWQFYLLRYGGGVNYGFVAKKNRIYSGFKPAGVAKWIEVWSDPCLKAGEWHHIALTYDKKVVRIYCDGVERGRTPVEGKIGSGKSSVGLIGHDSDVRPSQIRGLCGLMDELRVSNIARTTFSLKKHER